MPKKVVFFLSSDWWSPHLETDLELIERHLRKGDQCTVITCDSEISCCMRNYHHSWVNCQYCKHRTKEAIGLLGANITIKKIKEFGTHTSFEFDGQITNDLDSFLEFKYKGFEAGYAVASYLIDQEKNPDYDLSGNSKKVIKLINLTCRTFDWFDVLFKASKFDAAYAMNGRLLYYRGFFRAAVNNGVDCFLHERGGRKDKFLLVKNQLPHDLSMWKNLLEKTKDEFSKEEIRKIGSKFYDDRRRGIEYNYVSFVSDQVQGILPKVNEGHKRIGFFLSSEFAFAAENPEWRNPVYPNQNIGTYEIIKDLEPKKNNIEIFVRAHPNMRGNKNQELEKLMGLNLPNTRMIRPESPISSYELLDLCDSIFTFGSTVGVEAAYWGKPSVLAGKAIYEDLNCVYKCTSHEEVVSLLGQNLVPKPRDESFLYGAMISTFGEKFNFVNMESPFKGKFKNIDINRNPPLYKRVALKVLSLVS